MTIFEEMKSMTLYANKSFENGSAARKVLEYNLTDRAIQDRASVEALLQQGKSLEEAAGPYITETAFEEWYQDFCEALNVAAGSSPVK